MCLYAVDLLLLDYSFLHKNTAELDPTIAKDDLQF